MGTSGKDSLGRTRQPGQGAGSRGKPKKGDGGKNLTCPDWLGERGAAMWHWARDSMSAQGILSDKDGPAIDLFAGAWEEYLEARAFVMGTEKTPAGVVCESQEKGKIVYRKNPAAVVMANAWNRAKSLMHELGIGPRSTIEAEDAEDAFEEMLRRRMRN